MPHLHSVNTGAAMKGLFTVIFFLITRYDAPAQSVSSLMGARAAGLGYTSSSLADEWSLWNNAAGLSSLTAPSAAMAEEIHPALEGANRIAFAVASPVLRGVAAAGAFRFGDALYNEQIASAAFANKIGIASLGLKLNYIQYHAEGFANRQAISIGFGGIAALTPALSVGAFISNLNQPWLSHADHEQLPVQFTAGLSYKPSRQFLFVTEIQKDIDYAPVYRAGVEFQLHRQLLFRTGFNLHPGAGYFGLGWLHRKFKMDYALQYSASLGSAHQVSLIYRYERPKKKSGAR